MAEKKNQTEIKMSRAQRIKTLTGRIMRSSGHPVLRDPFVDVTARIRAAVETGVRTGLMYRDRKDEVGGFDYEEAKALTTAWWRAEVDSDAEHDAGQALVDFVEELMDNYDTCREAESESDEGGK